MPETPGSARDLAKHRREDFVRLHILADARSDILDRILNHVAEKGVIVYSAELEFLALHMRIGLDVALAPPRTAARLISALGAMDGVRSAHWEDTTAIDGKSMAVASKI